MSKYKNRIPGILTNKNENFFVNNPRAFANYTLNVNLLEGGSQELFPDQQTLRYAEETGNLLNNKLLLYKLFKGVNSSAN